MGQLYQLTRSSLQASACAFGSRNLVISDGKFYVYVNKSPKYLDQTLFLVVTICVFLSAINFWIHGQSKSLFK